MNEREAIVTAVEAGHAWLRFDPDAGCGGCTKAAGCGLGEGRGRPEQRVRNTLGARVGDRVVVSVAEGAVLKAAWRGYGVPLSLVLLGAAGGMAMGGEGIAVLGAVLGLAGGWWQLGRRQASAGEPLLHMCIKEGTVNLHRKATS
jgi:sigma-E factor negative regulatory protein RseC